MKKLLDSKPGADLTGAVGAWAAFVDPGKTLVVFLQAEDEAGARTPGKPGTIPSRSNGWHA